MGSSPIKFAANETWCLMNLDVKQPWENDACTNEIVMMCRGALSKRRKKNGIDKKHVRTSTRHPHISPMQNIDTTIAQQAIFSPPPLACPFPLQLKGQGAKLAMACRRAEKLKKKICSRPEIS